MFVGSKDDVDDFIALRSLSKTFFTDELVEPFPDAFFHVGWDHNDLD